MKKEHKKYKGMSLVEVMVAIGIFSIGILGFSLLLVSSWKSYSFIYETGQDSFVASRAVNLVVNDLRKIRQADNGDYPIKSASEFDLVVYVDIDNDGETEKVHYFLDQDNNLLRMGISEPSSDTPPEYSSGDDSVQTLASHVVNDSDKPAFSYFGSNYFNDAVPFTVPVASGKLSNIRIIRVELLIDIRPYNSPDHVSIQSISQLRNLKDYEE